MRVDGPDQPGTRVPARAGDSELEAAFARYEEIRRERTAAVVRKSHENRRQAFSPELAEPGKVAVSVAREWQQVRVRERLDWLYAYDATAVEI